MDWTKLVFCGHIYKLITNTQQAVNHFEMWEVLHQSTVRMGKRMRILQVDIHDFIWRLQSGSRPSLAQILPLWSIQQLDKLDLWPAAQPHKWARPHSRTPKRYKEGSSAKGRTQSFHLTARCNSKAKQETKPHCSTALSTHLFPPDCGT